MATKRTGIPLKGTQLIDTWIGLLKLLGLNQRLKADGVFGREAAKATLALYLADLSPTEADMIIAFLVLNGLAAPGLASDGTKGAVLKLSLLVLIQEFGNDAAKALIAAIEPEISDIKGRAAVIAEAQDAIVDVIGKLDQSIQGLVESGT